MGKSRWEGRSPHRVRIAPTLAEPRFDRGGVWALDSTEDNERGLGLRDRRRALPKLIVDQSRVPERDAFARLVANLPRDSEMLLVVLNRLLWLTEATVDVAEIAERLAFARPITEFPCDGEVLRVVAVVVAVAVTARDAEAGGPPLADVVVPVPHSGVAAALGYSRKSGVPIDEAIICNDADPLLRSFIQPDAAAREEAVRLKLSVISESVAGKRVLLVDDSLVRGTTARQLVARLRQAGAVEVLLRIASPPIAWPCYLGIDMPDRQELCMNQQGSVEAVARHLGVDDLRYLDLAGLRRSVGESFCMACMNGRYPV